MAKPIVSPRSAPPGAAVTVSVVDLPALTPVYLGIGATRSNFEVLVQLLTNQYGEMTERVQVPAWARSDRSHFFIVVDVYFRPLASSAPFYVTEPDGALKRWGRIVSDVTGCMGLRDDSEDHELFMVIGSVEGLEAGDSAMVEGIVADEVGCQESTTVRVTHSERLERR